jgi:hypothetical protein
MITRISDHRAVLYIVDAILNSGKLANCGV